MSGGFTPWLIYSAATFAVGLGTRAWVSYSANTRKRREAGTPIVDPFALAVAFAPRKTSPDDDEAVLDGMKQIVARVNRKWQALEFETVDRQLVGYYGTLAAAARPTARRAVVRLIESGEQRLQLIGARMSATVGIPEAAAPLRRLMDSMPAGDEANGSEPSELAQALLRIGRTE